jgi:anti-sigma regulatory factor (Ser/Thr protein kinase)
MGAARTSPGTGTGITVAIARDPALVRTVRLIAAAVARRASHDEELVEEVRLAVGEACALMVGVDGAGSGPVTVTLAMDGRLVVEVVATGRVALADADDADLDGVEPWALLRGLIEDLDVEQSGDTTTLRMSWRVGRAA